MKPKLNSKSKKSNVSINSKSKKSNKNIKKVSSKLLKSVKINKVFNIKKINKLIKNGKLKPAEQLRVGYVSKLINNCRYIVKIDNNKIKYYNLATKGEIECHTKLQENMKKFIGMYKSGHSPFKTIKGAMSFAIRETHKTFPKCDNTKENYNRKNENKTFTYRILDYINYYKKYIYYKFFNF